MKTPLITSSLRTKSLHGLTLLEMTLVICILMIFIGLGLGYSTVTQDWKKGKMASEALREVYSAQKTYLGDHPTSNVADLTQEDITPYLRNGLTEVPTVVGLDDATYTIKVNVSPPVIDDGAGGIYDPSDRSDDGLWDVGF
ncbi:pilus assembly FimT family protein [Sulfuriroseicoccus oceanibius]|uniref:Type II secretion system protein n=1 Tax=Sulfuriroseicoccus oceanibius TaxID=2707525 RepID=A0A6B3LD76_9BACT|nr:type II secretion system protein [Sulfuriroseicoccus oceanibius]QQL44489.1 type II secretion system protein [Sulfuriroseicoccus oceanibius]